MNLTCFAHYAIFIFFHEMKCGIFFWNRDLKKRKTSKIRSKFGSPWSLGRWWLGGGGDDSDEDHND